MRQVLEIPSPPRELTRARLAARRATQSRALLSDCRFCAHDCGVNRLIGERGVCRAGAEARIFSAQMEAADELELIPTYAIAFSGCDLRCAFCVTGRQSWNAAAGRVLETSQVAAMVEQALDEGARTVMILGGEPTIHLPSVLDLVARLPEEARLVWKTNAHGSAIARRLLRGLFDVWVADYKFGNDRCAERLALLPGYQRVVRDNLVWASGETDLIVRHLLMPGHVECCWQPIAAWLGETLPGVKVSLRAEYWPKWHFALHPELVRTVNDTELERARSIAACCKLNLVP